jgi:hypothetical protein
MRKMTTLFKTSHEGQTTSITREIRPENLWVFTDGDLVEPMIKLDGTACAVILGILHKRYDAKHGKPAPAGALPCQGKADAITGHFPHWVRVDSDAPSDKWHFDALNGLSSVDLALEYEDGTYELIGEKINGNPEGIAGHTLINHSHLLVDDLPDFNIDTGFDIIRNYLEVADMEGIVFHHLDGRRCKIRKTDFGFKREVLNGEHNA